jgi:hypothetical protein
VRWTRDLVSCGPFQLFCKERPELWQFLHTKTEADAIARAMNLLPFPNLAVGDTLYVDLRAVGAKWYNFSSKLPNEDYAIYVAKCHVSEFLNTKKTRLRLLCPVLEVYFDWNSAQCHTWGQYTTLQDTHTLVTSDFLVNYPTVKNSLTASSKAYRQLLEKNTHNPSSSDIPIKRVLPSTNPKLKPVPAMKSNSQQATPNARRSSRLLRGGEG